MADLYFNKIGNVLVISPSETGSLASIVEHRSIQFSDGAELEQALTRWIFADFSAQTLQDQWGNSYDHSVHQLIVGSLSEGISLINDLRENGLEVASADHMFVPFQRLDLNSSSASDAIRINHPRAFALARRTKPDLTTLLTIAKDASVLGGNLN